MICVSCTNEHQENFCPNCGERAGIPRITFKTISEDIFSTLTNMDKGFLFNIKALFLHPRKITIDYVLGKRKGNLLTIFHNLDSVKMKKEIRLHIIIQ